MAKHQCCAAFLFFFKKLESIAPQKLIAEWEHNLRHGFMHGYLDADLLHVMETQVPPGHMDSIGAFRTSLLVRCLSERLACKLYLFPML